MRRLFTRAGRSLSKTVLRESARKNDAKDVGGTSVRLARSRGTLPLGTDRRTVIKSTTDEEAHVQAAVRDADGVVRTEAARRISDVRRLAKVALTAEDPVVREIARYGFMKQPVVVDASLAARLGYSNVLGIGSECAGL